MLFDTNSKLIRTPESIWAMLTMFPSVLVEKHGFNAFVSSQYVWLSSVAGGYVRSERR